MILVPLSSFAAGGWQAWPEFAQDIWKHSNTFGVNLVGLRTIVAYDHAATVADARPARAHRLCATH